MGRRITGIPIKWNGDFLYVGAIGIGCVGYDLRKTPNHFSAYLGRDDHIIGWFPTREAAREEILRFVKEGRKRDYVIPAKDGEQP